MKNASRSFQFNQFHLNSFNFCQSVHAFKGCWS